jgi:hypothetical protein
MLLNCVKNIVNMLDVTPRFQLNGVSWCCFLILENNNEIKAPIAWKYVLNPL